MALGTRLVHFKMAVAARCLRSLVRSTTCLNKMPTCAAKSLTIRNARSLTSPSTTLLLKESGLLKGSKSLVSKVNFTSQFAPASAIACNISKASPAAVDCGAETNDGLECNLGDDDGETWSQSSDDPYLDGP